MPSVLFVYGISAESYINGPGRRCVLWTQGCSLKCLGCFNPASHEFNHLNPQDINQLAETLASLECDGLTISGGEPLDQSDAVYELIRAYKRLIDKTVLMFTGYSLEEITACESKKRTILEADATIAGRYIPGEIWNNKRLILVSDKFKADQIVARRDIEFTIRRNDVLMTGYPINLEVSKNEY